MGSKLVRDFVPGRRLAGEGPLNGTIRQIPPGESRQLLGAEKVVEEAQELLDAIREYQRLPVRQDLDPKRAEVFKAIEREIGDVYEALRYVGQQWHRYLDPEQAAAMKRKTHGGFTQNFVWEWPGDVQPRTIGTDGRIHDPDNPDCLWNSATEDKPAGCTCPKVTPVAALPNAYIQNHNPDNEDCPWNGAKALSHGTLKPCTCDRVTFIPKRHDPRNADCQKNSSASAIRDAHPCTCPEEPIQYSDQE